MSDIGAMTWALLSWRVSYLPVRSRVPMRCWAMWSDPPSDGDSWLINLALSEPTHGPQRNFDQARLAAVRLPRSERCPDVGTSDH